MYAAAKGISRSKPEDLSLALFIGTIRKPPITKRGRGTNSNKGRNPDIKAMLAAMTETGTVSKAMKNIKET